MNGESTKTTEGTIERQDDCRSRSSNCSLLLVPIPIKDANILVKRWHRHHGITNGNAGLFAVAVAREGDEEPCGAAIVGRPVGINLQDGWTCEVTRCVTDGTPNACSMLYGAAWRAAKALGYRRIITYTLPEEGGASLRAAGWRIATDDNGDPMLAGGGTWNRPNIGRPRVDKHPLQKKFRWERP